MEGKLLGVGLLDLLLAVFPTRGCTAFRDATCVRVPSDMHFQDIWVPLG